MSMADTHFVRRLGIDALARLALVYPLVMLLQMTSAGARRLEARALVSALHSAFTGALPYTRLSGNLPRRLA